MGLTKNEMKSTVRDALSPLIRELICAVEEGPIVTQSAQSDSAAPVSLGVVSFAHERILDSAVWGPEKDVVSLRVDVREVGDTDKPPRLLTPAGETEMSEGEEFSWNPIQGHLYSRKSVLIKTENGDKVDITYATIKEE